MRHTAKTYLIEILIPAYEAFLNHIENRVMGFRQDTQRAAIVAENCLHLADHVFNEKTTQFSEKGIRSIKDYRAMLFRTHQYYEIVCDFANSWKHRNINRKGKKLSSLDSAKEIFGIIRYQDQDGYYYDTKKFVWLILDDGQIHDFWELLHASLEMWIEELIQLQVIDSAPIFQQPASIQVSRSQAATRPQMKFLAGEGLPVEIKLEGLIFRQENGTVERHKQGDEFNYTFSMNLTVEKSRFTP